MNIITVPGIHYHPQSIWRCGEWNYGKEGRIAMMIMRAYF